MMPRYLYEYTYGDSKWNFDLWAEDADEARARLRLLAHAKYLGEVHAKIPANPVTGLFVRLWVAFAGFFKNPTP